MIFRYSCVSLTIEFGYMDQKLDPRFLNQTSMIFPTAGRPVEGRAGQVQPVGKVLHCPGCSCLPALPHSCVVAGRWLVVPQASDLHSRWEEGQ